MEQIYYTQCPIGYGLGASNGFQVKRITAGYPVAGDFRHLGVRAFPGGGRALAPTVLRYRREGDVAEVARLTPRAQEYQTERGLWGRPGGVFAHGLRLDAGELASVGNWPAGLVDAPGWRTADPEPTRGRPPEELDLAALGSFRPAEFGATADLFEGEDPDWLARLWTALAQVTREGRTLFLVDDPGRLARAVAALTVGLPDALRADVMFSTFHDRPEELPGYRLQGTAPVVRPNRPALLAQGIVADRAAGSTEPAVAPADWAVTLAGWMTRRDPIDEADWSATQARARLARRADDPVEVTWSDAGLDHLIGFPAAERDRSRPVSAAGWVRLARFARWAGGAGVGVEWLRHRGCGWWIEPPQAATRADDPAGAAAARDALLAHVTIRVAWRDPGAAVGWGGAIAAWFADAEPADLDDAVAAAFAAAPASARPAFAAALLRGLPADRGSAVLRRIRAIPGADRGLLLPLEAGVAAQALVDRVAAFDAGDDPAGTGRAEALAHLGRLVGQADGRAGAVAATLDAVAAVAVDHPAAADWLARAVAPAFDLDGAGEGRAALAWALRRDGDAARWLAPALRPGLADPGRGDLCGALRARVEPDLHPRLARAVLDVAADPGLPDDAFRLAVERLLLPLAPRPNRPTWAEAYLRRTPSTWDLFRRLYSKELAAAGLPAWLDAARARGELSPEQADRLDTIRRFARSLASGDALSLVAQPIPTGTAADRAQFFRQMLGRLGGGRLEGLPVVFDACRAAWPGAFDPGAAGLGGLARPLAERLDPGGSSPRDWLGRVVALLDRLGLTDGNGGYEPDGLLAELVAAVPPGPDPWPLRQFLFEHDRAWPALAATVRRDLDQASPALAPDLAGRWDGKIVKSARGDLPARFWELILNAAGADRLGAIVPASCRDLRTLGPLRWWGSAGVPGALADLRDAYARSAPLAPLPPGTLAEVARWLDGTGARPPAPTFNDPDEPIPLDDPEPATGAGAGPEAAIAGLSPLGRERWACLRALTEYRPEAVGPSSDREARFAAWEGSLPLAALGADDACRFAAWIILGVDPADPPRTTERLAAWLVRAGVDDWRRISGWADELPVEVAPAHQVARAGFVGTLGREVRTLAVEARARRRPG